MAHAPGQRFSAQRYDGWETPTPEDWLHVPLLTRADIQAGGKSLWSSAPPKEHGAIG